jgi:hypothetical protein
MTLVKDPDQRRDARHMEPACGCSLSQHPWADNVFTLVTLTRCEGDLVLLTASAAGKMRCLTHACSAWPGEFQITLGPIGYVTSSNKFRPFIRGALAQLPSLGSACSHPRTWKGPRELALLYMHQTTCSHARCCTECAAWGCAGGF